MSTRPIASCALADAAERAEQLPVDGIPPEIIALLVYDNDLENVQRQKAATPVRSMLPPTAGRDEFAYMCKPNAVVGERTSAVLGDVNVQQVAALHAVAVQSQREHMEDATLTIHTGNRVLDQFQSNRPTSCWLLRFYSRMAAQCQTPSLECESATPKAR